MPTATPVTDAKVLQAIADLLTAKSSSAALAHYPTLRIQTNNLHTALDEAMKGAKVVLDEWSVRLVDDAEVASARLKC